MGSRAEVATIAGLASAKQSRLVSRGWVVRQVVKKTHAASGSPTSDTRSAEARCPSPRGSRAFVRKPLFDLEDPTSLQRLSEPMTSLAPLRGTVVIDEVQRRPELFPVLRVLADRKPLQSVPQALAPRRLSAFVPGAF